MPSLPKHPEVSCTELTDKELQVCEAFEEYYSGLREVVRSRMELLRLDKERYNKTLPCLRTLGVEAINLDKSFGILMKNFEDCMAAAHYDVKKVDFSAENIRRERENQKTSELWFSFQRLAVQNKNLSRTKKRRGKDGKKGKKSHRD